ncbi:polynucleotide kinase 3 phosphatase-domain-containing protein [Mycena belliarum]|uniref:Polynucleotide kinase 3 phosphatase-domain-containing protein n=1 Tax=Mycena belliarum TaxID=1033014 RepID=A0AAD6Y1H9_9AGAR|nr:polynucleotide kinase 3 phosphatase-domain-containing protein [Mycena belliae]
MSASAPSSNKRSASQLDPGDSSTSSKIAKVHPFFSKTVETTPGAGGSLQWSTPYGPTCLYAVHLDPQNFRKVAAFDLDGTVIASKPFSAGQLPWHWWNAVVPAKLAEAVSDGYAIVLISNQGGLKSPVQKKAWKEKIALIADALPGIPFRLFAATAKDNYRKPMIGMWDALEKLYAAENVQIDRTSSFFVGDAAGRHDPNNAKKKDWASTDRKWALNVGIPFHTPEEYFLGQAINPNFKLSGFDVCSLPSLPLFTPSSSPLLLDPPAQELVLLVGYPCLGKTSFFRRYFEPAGYLHINQDTLKTRDKCVKTVQEALAAGKKCVVDNTNRDAYTRKYYLDVAKKLKVPVRCMYFTGSLELAWHNNLYRAYGVPPSGATDELPREVIPKLVFTKFQSDFEEPALSEGFVQIKKVNWVFNGTEEEKKAWSQWMLQFDERKDET